MNFYIIFSFRILEKTDILSLLLLFSVVIYFFYKYLHSVNVIVVLSNYLLQRQCD